MMVYSTEHFDVLKKISLSSSYFSNNRKNQYTERETVVLKKLFYSIYEEIIKERNMAVKMTMKEKNVILHIFNWSIGSSDFKGDLSKGLFLASRQGFGKDVILVTVVRFFKVFNKIIREYSNSEFCKEWFNSSNEIFKAPIKINDIKEDGRMKRERTAIPFLEFLDFREQNNLRRGLLVSSNLPPGKLQSELEKDEQIKRLEERIRECFNIVIIKGVESKRIENAVEF